MGKQISKLKYCVGMPTNHNQEEININNLIKLELSASDLSTIFIGKGNLHNSAAKVYFRANKYFR